MSPAPTRRHQKLCTRLAFALEQVLPTTHDVVMTWGWKPGPDEFIPDVMVHPVTLEQQRFTGMPVLVVEILSTNRRDDLVIKRAKYAAAGVPHYWVVDLHGDGSIDALRLDKAAYQLVQQVAVGDEAAVLSIGVADVPIDPAILR